MHERPRHVPVRLGDQIDLDIEALADGPDALAHAGGYVVLVPGALPGERVRVEITSAARKFGRGRVRRILRASEQRVTPRCRHFGACGGCHWQHLDYDAQLQAKVARLEKELRRALGDAAPPVAAPIPAESPYGGRHKVALQLARGRRDEPRPAMHRARELELEELAECPATAPQAFDLARRAIDALGRLREPVHDFIRGEGVLRSVLVRRAASTGEQHLIIVATRDFRGIDELVPELLDLGATTVSLNLNDGPPGRLLGHRTIVLEGPHRIREQIGDTTYLISPEAFFQTSPYGAETLVRCVRRALEPNGTDVVADLYCGGGLFALPLARDVREVFGIEESEIAVGDAQASARFNGLEHVQILRGAVEHTLRRASTGDLPRPTLCVLDPPRQGCDPAALRLLAELAPRRIAYVSCEPSALARDLELLRQCGYQARSVQPVDMFPQTFHVEAVAEIVPRRGGDRRDGGRPGGGR